MVLFAGGAAFYSICHLDGPAEKSEADGADEDPARAKRILQDHSARHSRVESNEMFDRLGVDAKLLSDEVRQCGAAARFRMTVVCSLRRS